MARTKKGARPLRFRGIPASLTGVVPDREDPGGDVRVSLRRPGDKDALEAMVSPDPDPRILRLSLPAEVGPGTYEGTLLMGGKKRAVQVEVEAAPGLRVVPEQLRVEAHPGDMVGADLILINTGNVPVLLRGVQAFGIFMAGGVEQALHRAYVDRLEGDRKRVDVIADNLAEAHPGLVKMKIQEGAGELAAGELREVAVTLDIPAGARPGRTYGGNWELANLVYPVTITVLGEEDGEEPDDEDEGEDDAPKTKGAR